MKTSSEKLWFLKNILLFSSMSPREMQEMERITTMQTVKKQQPLYLPGDPSNSVYLLKSGRVKVAKADASGREVTFDIIEAGEIFGELEVLGAYPRETYAEALDDALICVISTKDFHQYLLMHTKVAINIIKLVGLRLRRIQSRVEDLIFKDVPTRLAQLLLQLAASDGTVSSEGIRLKVKLTHQEIANLIGSTRETVSSCFGQFRNAGLIHVEGRTITITNPGELSKLVSHS